MLVWTRVALAVAVSAALSAASSSPALCAQRPQSCPGEPRSQVKKDIEFLAGPATEGRGVGTTGGQIAIDYIAARMLAIGLQPVPKNPGLGSGAPAIGAANSPLGEGTPRAKATKAADFIHGLQLEDRRPRATTSDSTVVLGSAGVQTPLALGSLAEPFRGSGSGKVDAPVVFVGYGLRVAEIGRDDYAGLDVRGKVVLVLRGQPHGEGADARLTEHRATTYANKFAAAEHAGAAAILFCNRAEDGVEPPAEREESDIRWASRSQGDTKLPAVWVRRDAVLNLFRRAGLGLIERQALIDAGKAGGCGEIPGATATIALEFGPPRPPRLTANVVGWLEGGDPERRAELVVVGAHHDHLGRGEFGSLGGQVAVGVVHPGADDNASGVAAMLEAARRLVARGGAGRSVVFIAFAAGEAGMQGSRAFLENCPMARDKIVAMVNLDSVGRAGQRPLQVEGVGSGLAFSDLFGRASRRVGIECRLREEAGSRADRSDHIAFLARKIPSVWLTTGVHDQYRKPSDVAALVDMDGVERVAQVVSEAVLDLGAWAKRPEFAGEQRRK